MNSIIFGMDVENILNYGEMASNTDHVVFVQFLYNCFDISKAVLFHDHPSLPENERILFSKVWDFSDSNAHFCAFV